MAPRFAPSAHRSVLGAALLVRLRRSFAGAGAALVAALAAGAWQQEPPADAPTEQAAAPAAELPTLRVVPVGLESALTASWLELVQLESSRAGAPVAPERIAELIDAQGGPRLAALRLAGAGSGRVPRARGLDVLRALVDEQWQEFAFAAEFGGTGAELAVDERVARLVALGRVDEARALAGALPASDTGAAARSVRAWAALTTAAATAVDPAPLAVELDALRATFGSETSGATRTLVLASDLSYLDLAVAERERARGAGDRAADWARRQHPSNEALASATGRDGAACADLLEAALAVPRPSLDSQDPAVALLERAAAADVLDPRPHLERARRHMGRYEFAAALVCADRALRRDPLDDAAWAIRSIASRELGDERAALLCAERALELRPGEPSHEERYVGCLVRLGLVDEAALVARDVHAYAPDLPWCAIAVALADNLDSPAMFQDRLLAQLERALCASDDDARLWAAAALGLARRAIDGPALALLAGFAEHRADLPEGRAAAALLAADPGGAPFWSGLALHLRNRTGEAYAAWRRDALGRDVDALRARALLTYFTDVDATGLSDDEYRAGTVLPPAWADREPLPVPRLPDASALALRVPVEAATVDQALALLPRSATRVVLGRGIHGLPDSITRGFTLVGLGTDRTRGTALRSASGRFNACRIDAGDFERVRFCDLALDARLEHVGGDLALRRCRVGFRPSIGDANPGSFPMTVEFDQVLASQPLVVGQDSGTLYVRDSVFAPASADRTGSWVFGVHARIERSVFHAGAGISALTVAGPNGSAEITDCVLVGEVAPDGNHGRVVATRDGARATLTRCAAYDLEPLLDGTVTATASTLRRTPNTPADVGGFTVVGEVLAPFPEAGARLRVPSEYASLDAALASAPDGATIELAAGLFELASPILRNVRLVGAGLNDTTVRLASSAPSLHAAARIELEDLFLAHAGFDPQRGLTQTPLFAAVADEPELVRALGGDVRMGWNVLVEGAKKARFTADRGGVVCGAVAYSTPYEPFSVSALGDGVVALGIAPLPGGHVASAVLTRAPFAARAAARPVFLAIQRTPHVQLEALRLQRLARLDEWFASFSSGATGVQLADAADRFWNLLPAGDRVAAILRRVEPRLVQLAREDARRGVEELIAFVFTDFGPGPGDEQVFTVLRSLARSFRAERDPAEEAYTEARLAGLDRAQADQAARTQLFEQALAAGRIDQAEALAEGLDAASRARVLVVTRPDELDYWQLDTLLRTEGLDATTRQRLQILKDARNRDLRPVYSPPVSAWAAIHAYIEASTTGVANEYFAFAETDRHGYWDVEVVARWDTVGGGSAVYGNPPPRAPEPGSSEAAWDAYYLELARWFP
jgi:tetratricopeptide (TPR) repeat protein